MPDNQRPLRVIQVGLGGWGRDWATRVLPHCPDVTCVACVDLNPAMLAHVQAQRPAPTAACFPSLHAALTAVAADAVLITTALPAHVPVALEALAAGKHVLVEKPFAPSLAEAHTVVAAADAADRVLMVSQNYRFYPAVRAVADLIRTNALGPVGAVSVQFRKYANTAPSGTQRHYAMVHPLLLDMAIHHFDLMRAVLQQEPTWVACHAWNPPWSHFRDAAAAVATVAFDGGAVVNYQGSWVSPAPATHWAGRWELECADGLITWTARNNVSLAGDAVTIRRRGQRPERIALPRLDQWDRAGALAAFVAAIRGETEAESSGRDNLRTLALTLGAVRAAETATPQVIADIGMTQQRSR